MTLENIINITNDSEQVEIVENDTFNSIFYGRADKVFSMKARNAWKKFNVTFVKSNNNCLYIEVETAA